MRLETHIGNAYLDRDAFKLANCDAHCRLITRAIDELVTHNFLSSESARDLIKRNTYGAFAELAAYDRLTRCYVKIATQVPMDSSEVLTTKGSMLDGEIEHGSVYFDVKAFGSNERLAQRLKERFEEEILDEEVLIEESWDRSFETFEELIRSASGIATELRQNRMVQKVASVSVLSLRNL